MAPPRRPPLRPTTIRTTTEKPGPSPAFLLPYNPELPFMEVGKIKQVPLREIWKREDSDFTVWLEKNIDYLNDVLDFEVTIEEREKSVGSFSLDLYGDDGMGGKVIIENQLVPLLVLREPMFFVLLLAQLLLLLLPFGRF